GRRRKDDLGVDPVPAVGPEGGEEPADRAVGRPLLGRFEHRLLEAAAHDQPLRRAGYAHVHEPAALGDLGIALGSAELLELPEATRTAGWEGEAHPEPLLRTRRRDHDVLPAVSRVEAAAGVSDRDDG